MRFWTKNKYYLELWLRFAFYTGVTLARLDLTWKLCDDAVFHQLFPFLSVWSKNKHLRWIMSRTYCHCIRFDFRHLQSIHINYEKVWGGTFFLYSLQLFLEKIFLFFPFFSVVLTIQRCEYIKWENANSDTFDCASQPMWLVDW